MTLYIPGILSPTEGPSNKLDMPIVFFDDFITAGYEAASAPFGNAADVGAWFNTNVEAGSGSTTIVVDDAVGGILKITSAANAADGVNLQLNGESFLPAAGKETLFEARFKADTVADHWFLGLCSYDVSMKTEPANYVGFGCTDSDADINIVNGSGASGGTIGTTADQTLGTHTDCGSDLVADTYVVIRFEMDGVNKVRFFVDGTLVGTHKTNIPTTEMTPSITFLNAGSGAQNWHVDYIFVAQER